MVEKQQTRSGQLTWEETLKKKGLPSPEDYVKEDKEYVIEKVGLSREEFNKILTLKAKSFLYFRTYHSTIRKLRFFIKIACRINLLSEIFYEKYSLKLKK